MGKLKFIIKSIIFQSLCPCLFALEVCPELDLSTGYRNDSLQRKNTLELTPSTVAQIDKIKINDISIWQVGVDGSVLMSPCQEINFEDCEYHHNFYLSGFAYWGWNISVPHLHETIVGNTQKQLGKAKIKDVRTYDYQIGAGYLFNWCHWNIGFSGGYAYDKQKISSKQGEISFPEGAPFEPAPLYAKGYRTATTWQGPWIGVELARTWFQWQVAGGYEYHFARYHANHSIPLNPIAQIEGYSTSTKANGNGNVFFLKGNYLFCSRWILGACFKYQYWNANHGHLNSPFFSANGYPLTTRVSAEGKWSSYNLHLNIGYVF